MIGSRRLLSRCWGGLILLTAVMVTVVVGCSSTDSSEPDTVGQKSDTDSTENDTGNTESNYDTFSEWDTADTKEVTQPLPPAISLETPVTEPGPFAVGYRQESVVYQAPGGQGERTLRLAVWYPATQSGDGPPKYLDSWTRDNVYLNADPASGNGSPWPVFVFSHGHQGFAEASWFLTEFLASHGFIVLAPDHTGNTLMDLIATAPTEIYYLRPYDLSATLDWLENLPAEHPLFGRASTTHIAVGGHSFGGYTAFAAASADVPIDELAEACAAGTGPSWVCSSMDPEDASVFATGFGDLRFRCALPMAPGAAEVLGPSGVANVVIPVLLQTGNGDRSTPDSTQGDPYWNELSGEKDRRVRYLTGGHHTFSITCEVLPSLGANDGCGENFMPFENAYDLVNAYSLAFLRAHLYEDPSVLPLLDGETSLSSEVMIEKHGP